LEGKNGFAILVAMNPEIEQQVEDVTVFWDFSPSFLYSTWFTGHSFFSSLAKKAALRMPVL
jgi:hypothetical protein